MKIHFDHLRITRNNALRAVENLSLEMLNTIPQGYNNNLAWNLGHMVVTQQLLCYKLSGNTMNIENDFVGKYRKGSKPEGKIDQTELDFIKSQMIILVDKTEDDFNNNLFTDYKEYPTSFNITLNSIDDAISFNNIHEGMHLGYILAMKKALGL